jgi:hypothetical protein
VISTAYWTTVPQIAPTTNRTSFEGIHVSVTPNTTTSTTAIIGSDNIFEVGSLLFYIVIGAGSGILILSLIMLIILIAICFLATNKGQSYILAIHDQSGDTELESPNLYWPQVRGTVP